MIRNSGIGRRVDPAVECFNRFAATCTRSMAGVSEGWRFLLSSTIQYLKDATGLKFLRLTGLALSLSLIWIGSLRAAEPGAALKFAVFNFFPWSYTDDRGEVQGISVDIVKLLSQRMGQPILPHRVSVARAFRDVQVGAVEFVLAYRDPQMVPRVAFVGDFGCLRPMVTLRSDVLVSDISGFSGHRIGFVSGGFYDTHYKGRLATTDVLVNSVNSMIKMIARERLDGFVINDGILAAYRSRLPRLQNDLPDGWESKLGNSVHLARIPVSIATAETAANSAHGRAMAEAIRTLVDDGSFHRLMQSWGAVNGWACE